MKGVRVSPGPPSKDAAGGHLDERSNDSVRSPSQRDSARARSAWHKQAPTPLRESQSSASLTGSLDTETPGVAQQTSFGAVGHACACVGERFFWVPPACTLPVTIWGSSVPLHRPLVAAPRMHSRRTLACTAGPPSRRRMCGREGRHKPPRNKLRLIRLPFNATHYRWASRPCRWPSIGHDRRASWCAARAHDPIPIPNTNAEPDLA